MLPHAAAVIKESPESNAFSRKMHTVLEKMLKFSVFLIQETVRQMLLKLL